MIQVTDGYRALAGAATVPPPDRTLRPAGDRADAAAPTPVRTAVPALPPTARKRRNEQWGVILWSSILLSVALHWAAFALWPSITAPDIAYTASELAAVELPPEVEIPPPPQAIARPAVPVVATATIDEDITIAPTTFEANPVSELPPPPEDASSIQREISEAPTFTPFTVSPELVNRAEAATAIMKSYPPNLRDAGIGGTVMMWFYIDTNGTVQNTRVAGSSGFEQLDQAAMEVAPLLRFSPALNRDKVVPVWVQLPILFTVR